jgi:CheY-like chemotaxis protein
METARVLIIEDHAPDVYLVKEALRASGLIFELTHVNDGNAARIYLIDVTSGGVPDLIFLDLNLPKADGLEILRMIRTWPHLAHVPVAILTSSSSPEDKEKAYRLGANLYITKPAGLSEFLATVGNAAKQLLEAEGGGGARLP